MSESVGPSEMGPFQSYPKTFPTIFRNLHFKSGGVSNVIKVILVKSDPKVKWHVATNNKDNKRHYLTD